MGDRPRLGPLQGAATRSGNSHAGTNGCGQGCRQPARCRPMAAAPVAGAAAHVDCVQRRHLRRAAVATAVQMGARRGL
ncbi:hypothetical protein GW17_00008882, partial [Ensete ventricosum]